MSEENKAVVRRFLEEVFNNGNLAVIDELIAPGFVEHPSQPGQQPGPEGAKQAIGMFRAAFPDLRVTIDDMIAEGDRVVVRTTFTGTHQGDMMGIPPTGKQVSLSAISIERISGGKFVERREQADMMGMMQQLGVVPSS